MSASRLDKDLSLIRTGFGFALPASCPWCASRLQHRYWWPAAGSDEVGYECGALLLISNGKDIEVATRCVHSMNWPKVGT